MPTWRGLRRHRGDGKALAVRPLELPLDISPEEWIVRAGLLVCS